MNPGLASLDAIEAQMREREWESVDSEALASLFVVGLRVLQDEISSQKLRADYLGSVLADRGEQVDELLAYVEGQKGASLANEAWWCRHVFLWGDCGSVDPVGG